MRTRKAAPAKRASQGAAKKPAAKAPAKTSRTQATYDVSKTPTAYHKHFAKWSVNECGLELDGMSVRAAFLKGIQIATAARPIFMKSDFLAEWREETGQAKRGPKTTADRTRRSNRQVVSDDEFEDEDEFESEGDELPEGDDEFEEFEDENEEPNEDDDEEFEDEREFEDEEDEDEPEPPKRGRSAAGRKGVATRGASGRSRTPAPLKRPARGKKPVDDDEFVF